MIIALTLLILLNLPIVWHFSLYLLPAKISSASLRQKPDASIAAPLRFAVIVCAHNEEAVLGDCLDSIMEMDYPSFQCFVVADNCTDQTAAIAQSKGATVFVRNDLRSSKGLALSYGINRILNQKIFDAVCIFDSDNLATPDFLKQLAFFFSQGYDIVCGNRKASNADSSLISACYTIYWSMVGNVYGSGHCKQGLNAMISGTGFSFRTSALAGGWHTKTFVEDIEFYIQASLRGKRIVDAPLAVYYDQQPETLRTSCIQFRRWTTGNLEIIRAYGKCVLAKLFQKPDAKAFDLFFFYLLCVNPCGNIICELLLIAAFTAGGLSGDMWILLTIIATYYVFAVIVGCISARKSGQLHRHRLPSLLIYPFFIQFLYLMGFSSLLHPVKEWIPIPHRTIHHRPI